MPKITFSVALSHQDQSYSRILIDNINDDCREGALRGVASEENIFYSLELWPLGGAAEHLV